MNQVAIAGIRGSYSESAASEYFSSEVELIECSTFEGVFGSLRTGLAQFAVIPVSNSTVGEIASTASLMRKYRPEIVGKIVTEVAHVLAVIKDAEFEDVTAVRSHAEALRQCSNFFAAHPGFERVTGFDTASSVRSIVTTGLPHYAAVCSERAAEIYGAKVVRRHIANQRSNATTFVVIRARGEVYA